MLGESLPLGAKTKVNGQIRANTTTSVMGLNIPFLHITCNIPAYQIVFGQMERPLDGEVYYGIETLMQLINPEQHIASGKIAPIAIQCHTITDYPRFAYRGMHLDVARAFSDKETVMRYIDNMARHKFNKFHWHLVDDEGWRIEIKSYPRLNRSQSYGTLGGSVRICGG